MLKNNFISNQLFCVDDDGDITCFELGDLPPQQQKDPKDLGITLPCCNKNKKLGQGTRKRKNRTLKRKINQQQPVETNNNMTSSHLVPSCANTALVYVYDENGFKTMATYTKGHVECVNVNLKTNYSESSRNHSGKEPYKRCRCGALCQADF